MNIDLFIIDPEDLPPGQALKSEREIHIGRCLEVSESAGDLVDRVQLGFGHNTKRETIEHILNALAVKQISLGNGNKSLSGYTRETPRNGVKQ